MSGVWDSGFLPPGVTASSVSPLTGGAAHSTWLVRLADGRSVVVKGGQAVADSLFTVEAAGLATLRAAGLRTPDVLQAGAKSLVLAALNPALPETGAFWEELGRLVAGLHAHTGPRYGWDHDGWLGLLRQENAWDDDGHRFFSQRRILRYLRELLSVVAHFGPAGDYPQRIRGVVRRFG
jgi:fructosamine-3-kinase